MDSGTITILVTASSGVLTALTSAIAYQYRQGRIDQQRWGETWQSLYHAEKADHAQTKRDNAEESRASTHILKELSNARAEEIVLMRANNDALKIVVSSQAKIAEIVESLARRREDRQPDVSERRQRS